MRARGPARPPELARASSVGSDGDEFARDLDAPAEDAPRGASAAGVDDEERPRAVPGRADEGDRAAPFRLDHGELNRSRVLYGAVGVRGKVVAEAVDPMGATDEATGAAISLGRHLARNRAATRGAGGASARPITRLTA